MNKNIKQEVIHFRRTLAHLTNINCKKTRKFKLACKKNSITNGNTKQQILGSKVTVLKRNPGNTFVKPQN